MRRDHRRSKQPNPRQSSKPGYGPPFVWLCICALLALLAWTNARDAWQETYYGRYFEGWQTTPGTITQSRAVLVRLSKNKSESRVYVEYEYRVAGRRYENTRIRWTAPVRIERNWYEPNVIPQRMYPPGATVPVYYDPAAPGMAVLDRKTVFSGWDHETTFVLSTVFGLLCLFFGLRSLAAVE